MFCSREYTNCLMIQQQSEKSTQMIFLVGRCFSNGHSSMTLWEVLAQYIYCSGPWETELSAWVCWSCKDCFWINFALGWCGSLERMGFEPFLLWEEVLIWRGLIFNNFHSWPTQPKQLSFIIIIVSIGIIFFCVQHSTSYG